jgi:nicotinate phosphoribosyltransferase
MVPVFKDGKCIYHSPKVMDIQKYCKEELATLWEESLRLEYPHRTHVDLSMPLWKMKNELLDKYHFE